MSWYLWFAAGVLVGFAICWFRFRRGEKHLVLTVGVPTEQKGD